MLFIASSIKQRGVSAAAWFMLCLCAPLFMGCTPEESFESKILGCAELPAAFASPNAELVELVQAMRTTGGMPNKLERSQADQESNAALLLPHCASDAERLNLIERVPWLVSRESYEFDPTNLIDAAKVIEKKSGMMDRYSVASDQPYCVFQVGHLFGFFGPMDYLDDTQLAVRLFMTRSYDAARVGEVQKSLKDIERALRWTHWLSRVKKPEARILAATLRSEVFDAISSLLNKGIYRRQEAELLFGMLLDHLTDWPADRRMLVGDRAAAAHAYEAFRIGLTHKILSYDEQSVLERQNKLRDFLEATPEQIDQDEVNYLRAMQTMINASGEPFYKRINTFESARQIATTKPNLYADRFFLVELIDAQRVAARDRTLCEAWCLALAGSADLKLPNFRFAPVNGREYELEFDASRVTVKVGNPGIIDPSCPKL